MFSMHRDLIIGIVQYKTKSMKDHFIIVVLRGVRWNSFCDFYKYSLHTNGSRGIVKKSYQKTQHR